MPPPSRFPLEPDSATFRAWALAALGKLGPFLDRQDRAPLRPLTGSRRLADRVHEPLPEHGAPLPGILQEVMSRLVPTSLNTTAPGFMGFIPGGGLPAVAIADLITAVTNRYTALWRAAPGLVQAEINVIRWLCQIVGYPPDAGGILTSGGSMANLTALVAAREDRLGEAFGDGLILISEQTHHSIAKAARISGFRADQIRPVAMDENFRIRPAALVRAIEEGRAAGLRPFLLVASAGSTAVGAVDPLAALGEVCAAEGLWFHVDAAYGGCFAWTARGREVLKGLESADSITLDPHKGLFLPYGTGTLLVRERERLRTVFSEDAAYMPSGAVDPDHWDFADLGPELTRPGRGLRIWLPLKLYGAAVFRSALDEKLDLAREAHERIAGLPDVRVVTPPTLSLFTFRVEPAGHPDWNDFNRRILRRVNRRQRVFLTGATLRDPGPDSFVIRVCILSFRTHLEQIDVLLEDLRGAMEETLAQWRRTESPEG